MKLKTLVILTMMLLTVIVLTAAAKKPDAKPLVTGQPDTAEAVDSYGLPVTDSTAEDPGPIDGEEGSAHISEAADRAVQIYLIPILVLILGTLTKLGWDAARFKRLLYITWGWVKECDNFFSHPSPAVTSQIDAIGLNAAKKNWTEAKLNMVLSDSQISLANKKTGSTRNLIELAINVFKYGGPAITGLIGLIKKWK